ncbi:hypothetical protein [Paenirhodobacter sp.]
MPVLLSMWQHWPGGDDFLHPPPWADAGAMAVNERAMEITVTARYFILSS